MGFGGCGTGGFGGCGGFTSTGVILVLFILLVIVLRSLFI
ncbi:sporulation protein YjcZ [Paenibacillus tyrfis]|nr:sporulation protein YjcZ [Paenibacillus tyrfis]MCP1310183.1 sporulation protein YjcZ [Paenibacillus tyrfis]